MESKLPFRGKYAYYAVDCQKCGRKILVEIFLVGANHNLNVIATCADCMALPLNSEFAKEHPVETENIEKWLKEKRRINK